MQNAAIVLSLAAVGGAVVASFPLRGIPRPPTWLALGHGLVGAIGVILLIAAAVSSSGIPVLGQISLALFLAAALGGLGLFVLFHLKERPLPKLFVLAHGLLALSAVVLLWIAVCQT